MYQIYEFVKYPDTFINSLVSFDFTPNYYFRFRGDEKDEEQRVVAATITVSFIATVLTGL